MLARRTLSRPWSQQLELFCTNCALAETISASAFTVTAYCLLLLGPEAGNFEYSALHFMPSLHVKKGPPHDQKHVVTKDGDFPITFSIRFYNSLCYRTRCDKIIVK